MATRKKILLLLFMILFLICCWHHLTRFVGSSATNSGSDMTWSKADDFFIEHSFTPFDYCVLSSLNRSQNGWDHCPAPQNQAEAMCSILHSRMHNMASLLPIFPHTLLDIPSEFESRSKYHSLLTLSQRFSQFNTSNRILVLIGDSITRNTIEALLCILQREHNYHNVSLTPSLYDYNKIHKKGGKLYQFSFPNSVTDSMITVNMFYFAIWVCKHYYLLHQA